MILRNFRQLQNSTSILKTCNCVTRKLARAVLVGERDAKVPAIEGFIATTGLAIYVQPKIVGSNLNYREMCIRPKFQKLGDYTIDFK